VKLDKDLYKTAEDHYNFLLSNYKDTLNSKEIEKLAFAVVTKMAEVGTISTPEEAIEKIAEYREKGLEDLKIIEKAIDLGPVVKTAEHESVKLGSLSDSPSGDGQDNLTSFLLEDI